MEALRGLVLATLVLAAPAKGATRVESWTREIREASKRFGIPEQWIRDVMRVESDGRLQINGLPITSPAGAMGLMQLMPGTWADMRRAYRLGHDPYDPHDNILAGTAYLRAMYELYGYPGALAAYNAGPSRFAEHLATGRPLAAETIAYVERIVGRERPREKDMPHRQSVEQTDDAQIWRYSRSLFFFRRATPVAVEFTIPGPRDALVSIHGRAKD